MIRLREATVEDIPTLVRWGNSAPELWGSQESKWYTQKGVKRMIDDKDEDILLVAVENGILVGMCLSRYMHEWYYCCALYIDKPFRGRGIAKLLLTETEKQAKARGVGNLGFDARADNTTAIALYEKLGFKKCHQSFWFEKKF
jgi:ribosomal protein S18 acetylase RimI-like enzyme